MCKGLPPERTTLTLRQGSNPFKGYNLQNSVSVLIHTVPSNKEITDFSSLHVSIENEHHQAFVTELKKTRQNVILEISQILQNLFYNIIVLDSISCR